MRLARTQAQAARLNLYSSAESKPVSASAPSRWSRLGTPGADFQFLLADPSDLNLQYFGLPAGQIAAVRDGSGYAGQIVERTMVAPEAGSPVLRLWISPVQHDSWFAQTAAGIYRSANGGNTWTWLNLPEPANANLVVALDSRDEKRIWVGGWSLYSSDDGGGSWIERRPPGMTGRVTQLAVSPYAMRTVAVGLADGSVLVGSVGSDGAFEWNGGRPRGGTIGALDISADESETVYVGYAEFATDEAGNFFVSGDAGRQWHRPARSAGGLPDAPVLSLLAGSARMLYAGTSIGLFVSTDAGETWMQEDMGPLRAGIASIHTRATSAGTRVYTTTTGGMTANIVSPQGCQWELRDPIRNVVDNFMDFDWVHSTHILWLKLLDNPKNASCTPNPYLPNSNLSQSMHWAGCAPWLSVTFLKVWDAKNNPWRLPLGSYVVAMEFEANDRAYTCKNGKVQPYDPKDPPHLRQRIFYLDVPQPAKRYSGVFVGVSQAAKQQGKSCVNIMAPKLLNYTAPDPKKQSVVTFRIQYSNPGCPFTGDVKMVACGGGTSTPWPGSSPSGLKALAVASDTGTCWVEPD